MPFCHRCGTKLDEDANFCQRCGVPVAIQNQATVTYRQRKVRNPFIIAAIVIAALIFSALIIAAISYAPFYPVNSSQTSEINQPHITSLNLNFQSDVSNVHVFTNLTDKAFLVNVTTTGCTNVFGSSNPVKLTVENSTADGVLTVSVRVDFSGLPSGSLQVNSDIYVNPKMNLTLNVNSDVGTVSIDADSSAKIQALNLKAITGTVQVNVEKGASINGDLSLQTTTGTVSFSMDQADINGNVTVNLQSTTGSVNINATETQKFNGNIQFNATVQTGTVNLNSLLIDGEVGARIESHTTLGKITVNVQQFSGNQSPLQTDNYPASCNIRMNLRATTGDIHINAFYQTKITPTSRN
jgi:cytoskeletal protein CcmA (bactofilin family)